MCCFCDHAEELEAERKNATQTDSVETYEEAFERIRRVAGAEDTDTLVKRFIECEDTNFALFNFVNEQNNELELLSEQIQQASPSPPWQDQSHSPASSAICNITSS